MTHSARYQREYISPLPDTSKHEDAVWGLKGCLTLNIPASHNHFAMQVQQEDDAHSLFWITVKVLMFLVPFLLLLRIVTAMREIRLSRNTSGQTAEHSLSAILWVWPVPFLRIPLLWAQRLRVLTGLPGAYPYVSCNVISDNCST